MTLSNPVNPVPLAADHDLSSFECGVPILDDWLKKRALRNEASGVSRTYVITLALEALRGEKLRKRFSATLLIPFQ